jgi:prevent-host-death family protein
MRTMGAGEFKAKCLAVFDEVQATGEPVIVTKRGKPVARVVALEEAIARKSDVDTIFRSLRGLVTVNEDAGDLVEPLVPVEEWDHLKDDWSPFPSE